MTLSHCWGAEEEWPQRLLKENYGSMRAEMADLPRTFREAIQITRLLQVRYLWIDSLCIIQDVPADWEVEAFMIHEV